MSVEQQLIDHRIALATDQGVKLIAALQGKIASLNLPGEAITIPPFAAARFTLEHNPGNGEQSLRAAFHPTQYYCNGFLVFHADGSCFAEYHVMQLHPTCPQYFIEAVEAWVRDGKIQTDTRLAVMPW